MMGSRNVPRCGISYLTPDKGCKCCGKDSERLFRFHRVTCRIFPYERGCYGDWVLEGYGFTCGAARRDALRRLTEKRK